jgi:GGDEF domain-containing protein
MLAKRLHTIIEAHNEREERGYAISLSTGIAYYDPENPSPLDTLMAQADEMMYKSKKGKRNG